MWIPCSMLVVYLCLSGVASAKDMSDTSGKDSGLADGKTPLAVNTSKPEIPGTSLEHSDIASKSHAPDQQQQDFINLTQTDTSASRNIPKLKILSTATHNAPGKDGTVPMEGGSLPPPLQVNSDSDSESLFSDVEQSGVQTQNKSRKVSPRKGTKIVARKGVDISKESDSDELSFATSMREKKNSTGSALRTDSASTSSLASTTVRNLQGQPISEDSNEKKVLTVNPPANNNTSKPSLLLPGSSVNASTVSPTQHRKKSKPDLTFDKDDLPRDSEGRVLLDEVDEVDSGPATDYVVPVVLSMMAVPLLAIAGAFIYKKGRDFWERRHYRRMDFLIDGMYND